MRFDVRDTRNKNWLWIRRELLRKHGDELGAHGIAVYAALASYAGRDNTAYPSMQSMADLIDCSRRTVQRSIKTLHDLGWVGYEQQHKEDGGQTSHLFYLLECPCESESPPRDTDSHPPVQESRPP
jgi:DNA-binding transcriptional MocR family regulator